MNRFLIKLRNRWHPSNRVHVDAVARFDNRGNLLRTQILVRGSNTVIIENLVRLQDLIIEIRGTGNLLSIGTNAYVCGKIELFGDNNTITIGRNSMIRGAFLAAHHGTTLTIGNHCLFSREIDVRTTDSHTIYDSTGAKINPDKNITIGDKVWLGLGVCVLKGAHIHREVVIGTRSLVTGVIPHNCIAAGVPAKPVRHGITWES